jgi:NADPH:quinone reductase-like Zn-dependent oxidoreductase
MRAFVVHELTHPSKIPLERNVAEPTVGPQEVLVDIYSAGLNFVDVSVRDPDARKVLMISTDSPSAREIPE